MLKLIVTILAFALAGAANAAGWRNLRIDGSGQAAFEESVAALQEELTPSRRYAFSLALQDIWIQGTWKAEAEQREYTSSEYFAQLDGLKYEEVVRLIDPTGKKAKQYRAQYYYARAGAPQFGQPSWGPESSAPVTGGSDQHFRGSTTQIQSVLSGRSASGQPCGQAPGC